MNAAIVKEIRTSLGLTQPELARRIGVSIKTIANYEAGNVIPASKQALLQELLEEARNKVKSYLNLNSGKSTSEIITTEDGFFNYGIGGNEVKVTPSNDKIAKTLNDKAITLIRTGADKQDPQSGKPPYETYLLPLSAMGGPLSGFAADSVTLANCEKIVSPIEDVDFAITIYGESMYPKYPSGARLLIKKINPDIFIDWGKAYVLDTSNGVIVKEVRMSDREGCIACHSINPDPKFRPFDVPLSEVYGMYRVLMSLSAE